MWSWGVSSGFNEVPYRGLIGALGAGTGLLVTEVKDEDRWG